MKICMVEWLDSDCEKSMLRDICDVPLPPVKLGSSCPLFHHSAAQVAQLTEAFNATAIRKAKEGKGPVYVPVEYFLPVFHVAGVLYRTTAPDVVEVSYIDSMAAPPGVYGYQRPARISIIRIEFKLSWHNTDVQRHG